MSRVEIFSKLNKWGGRGWNMIPKINKRASPLIGKLKESEKIHENVTHIKC